jgi:hypothetical protein
MARRAVPVAFVAMKLPWPGRYAPVPGSAIACRSDDATGLLEPVGRLWPEHANLHPPVAAGKMNPERP